MPEVTKDEEQEYEITTTAQVERTYKVQAGDEDTAHKRLRRHLEDPESLREGLVALVEDSQIDFTPQRVKVVKPVSKPRAVDAAAG